MRLYDQTINLNSFTNLHINTRLLTSPASEIMRLNKKEVAHAAHSDKLWRPALTAGGGSSSTSLPTSTTSLTQDLTTFEDIWSGSASKLSDDDWSDVEHDSRIARAAWPAPNAPAMAEDFSEGRLETLVGSPQKELAGTQNAFVSYLVTTKVHFLPTLCAAF
jgi:hypothetical protein